MLNAIPQWNAQGVVPPVDPNDPVSFARSPYTVPLREFVRHYAISPTRITILRGLLEYRAAIEAAGITQGFQWINGSFLEYKELRLGEDPNDIDVVTFYRLPPNTTQAEVFNRNSLIFAEGRHEECKQRFRIDGYFQSLTVQAEHLIFMSNYWYGMWSHQRDTFRWKGFFQVSLSSAEDVSASNFLRSLSGGAIP